MQRKIKKYTEINGNRRNLLFYKDFKRHIRVLEQINSIKRIDSRIQWNIKIKCIRHTWKSKEWRNKTWGIKISKWTYKELSCRRLLWDQAQLNRAMPSVNRAKPSLIGPCPASMGPSPAFWDPAQRYKSKLNLIGPCPASRDQAQQQINETRRRKITRTNGPRETDITFDWMNS